MNAVFYWQLLKYFLTVFTLILVPIYSYSYGPTNFLWLSDIGLFLTVLALWTNSRLLMSMAAVGVLFLELVWVCDFFFTFLFRVSKVKLADYMFDNKYSLILRALSLFHIITPLIWVLYLQAYGYDTSAFYYFTGLFWLDLLVTYLFTGPKTNINWVFLPQVHNIKIVSLRMWLLIMFIGFPLVIFLPTHYVCIKLFNPAPLNLSTSSR